MARQPAARRDQLQGDAARRFSARRSGIDRRQRAPAARHGLRQSARAHLRASGFAVDYSLTPAKPDKQFKRAQELKAGLTVKVEGDSTFAVRDLRKREDSILTFESLRELLSQHIS